MQSQLTERFIECMDLIKTKHKIPSTRQFSKLIDVHPQCISDLVNGKRAPNADLISRLVQVFSINANYIFTGQGSYFLTQEDMTEPQVAAPKSEPVVAVVTDNDGNERIAYVPYAAQAGYADQFHDPIYMQQLKSFTLPDTRFETGTHRCFEVSGDSMEPTIFTGEQLVCSFVDSDQWATNIRDNYVYVVITSNGMIVKRLKNNLKVNGTILAKSDNSFYEAYELDMNQIKEVWLVTHKISPFMPSPNNIRNALHKEVDNLRMTISDQGKMIYSLNSTIEKMLKQNRQLSVRF